MGRVGMIKFTRAAWMGAAGTLVTLPFQMTMSTFVEAREVSAVDRNPILRVAAADSVRSEQYVSAGGAETRSTKLQDKANVEEIVVTGTHIRGSANNTS